MSAGERVFSVVRGRLYERLPTLALPLGKISCCEADVMPAGTDGQAALFASGFLEREFLEGSMLPERLTLHLLLHLMLGHPQSRMGRDRVLWDTACDLERKYKDPDYSSKKLAEDLNTNSRYISAVCSCKFQGIR